MHGVEQVLDMCDHAETHIKSSAVSSLCWICALHQSMVTENSDGDRQVSGGDDLKEEDHTVERVVEVADLGVVPDGARRLRPG